MISLIVFIFAAAALVYDEGQASSPTMSKETAVDGFLAARGNLRSLSAKYTLRGTFYGPAPADPSITTQSVLALGRHRLIQSRHHREGSEITLDMNENIIYHGGKLSIFYKVWQRVCHVYDEESARRSAWKFNRPFLLEALGWRPPDDPEIDLPSETPPLFLDLALRRLDYRLLPERRLIDGFWCVGLVADGKDELWIDAEHGWILRRRIRYIGNPAVRLSRYDLSDYRDCGEGVWLPVTIKRTLYDWKASQDGREPPIDSETHCTVAQLLVNHVDTSGFRIVLLPGTLVRDDMRGTLSQTPGGLDLLEDTIEVSSKLIDGGGGGEGPVGRVAGNSNSLMILFWLLLFVVVIWIVLNVVLPRSLRVAGPDDGSQSAVRSAGRSGDRPGGI